MNFLAKSILNREQLDAKVAVGGEDVVGIVYVEKNITGGCVLLFGLRDKIAVIS